MEAYLAYANRARRINKDDDSFMMDCESVFECNGFVIMRLVFLLLLLLYSI